MTIDEVRVLPLSLLATAVSYAVDACLTAIACASVPEIEGAVEWRNLGDDFEDYEYEVDLLKKLGVVELRPDHPTWVRRIAG